MNTTEIIAWLTDIFTTFFEIGAGTAFQTFLALIWLLLGV
jgi:hypothetical protein